MSRNSGFEILLYYKYVQIADPKQLLAEQKALCQELSLTGRILIAHEGINGTVEGTAESIDQYSQALKNNPLFTDIHLKKSPGTGSAFPKLSIKVRDEIVSSHLGKQDVNPVFITGKYLQADELHDWIHSDKEFYIVDMRNDYEQKSGYFENSILSQFGNFRDLPAVVQKLDHLKDKTIVTVCTGGVRCEKASGFLVNSGFADVYQLYGGIVTYMEKYPNEDFIGKLYVFDNRVLMGFNTDDAKHQVVGTCLKCGRTCEEYINCQNDACHLHFICCQKCRNADGKAYCSQACENLILANPEVKPHVLKQVLGVRYKE